MSTLMHPVGPEPSGVYWRRRVVLLLAVVGLVVLVVAVSGRGGRADTVGADAVAGGAAAGADAAPEAPAPGAAAPAGGAGDGDGPPGEDVPSCDGDQVEASVTTDAKAYGASAAPRFVVTAENSGDSACAVDLAAGGMVLLLVSGDDRVWSSADCQADVAARPVTLGPGDTEELSVSWQRVRSADGCPADLPEPGPGSYEVTATVGGATSAPAVFTLD